MLAGIGGFSVSTAACISKKAQLSLTNPRDACEKFAVYVRAVGLLSQARGSAALLTATA